MAVKKGPDGPFVTISKFDLDLLTSDLDPDRDLDLSSCFQEGLSVTYYLRHLAYPNPNLGIY